MAVFALVLLFIGLMGVSLRKLWSPSGVLGYTTDGDGTVIDVQNGSPAAEAGIEIGDRIDVAATPGRFRILVVQLTYTWAPGDTIRLALLHGGGRRDVTLTAAVAPGGNSWDDAFLVIRFGASVLFVALGAALVLLRPTLMTWGFFAFCLYAAPADWFATALPSPAGPAVFTLYFVACWAFGVIGLLVFAVSFLSDPAQAWRQRAIRWVPALAAALLAYNFVSASRIYWLGGPPGELLQRVQLGLIALVYLAALGAFIETYFRARGTDRQRIRWVLLAFAISLAANVVSFTLQLYVPGTPAWLLQGLNLLNVLVPLTVAYSVIKHRVIDVNFVVSRALVYGVLTTILVGGFSIVDWLFSDWLKLSKVGTLAEVTLAVAAGFWFNGLHRRVDGIIDATFFAQRHRAEQALVRVASALPFASTTAAVAEFLVVEPARILQLASAAIFRRRDDGTYGREASVGWGEQDLAKLDADDERLLSLLRSGGPVSLYDHPWRTDHVPSGPAHPIFALPIMARRELVAVAFYGSHLHGEALDPDEIKALESLATGAAAAYDHLETEAMRNTVIELRKTQSAHAQFAPTPTIHR